MIIISNITTKIQNLRILTQLVIAIFIGSLAISAFIYFYFINNQNSLYQEYFSKNSKNINEVLRLSIELGASNEQYDALIPIFDWAIKDSSLKYIFLFDDNNDLIVDFPLDNSFDIEYYNAHKNEFTIDNELFVLTTNWKAKFGNGTLITVFSTEQLVSLKNEAIINLSTSMSLILLISLASFTLLALGITKPLRKLADGTSIIAAGDEHFRMNTSYGSIEIRSVSKSINNMLDRLSESQQQRLLEEKSYNKILEQKNETLIELHNEKNEFLGIVAHDLKNPIAAILLYAQIVKMNHSRMTDNEIEQNLSRIETTSKSMTNLIRDLLDINAIESGLVNLNFNEFDLTVLVRKAADDFDNHANQKEINLELTLPDKLFINADKERIKQIIDNLISNAIKFSPKSKTVFIRCLRHADKVIFEVQDEGPGIKADEMNKLFGKFNRLSAKPTGGESSSGLGLSIAKKLTEQMNGKIWCESEFGAGAKFCLEFELIMHES